MANETYTLEPGQDGIDKDKRTIKCTYESNSYLSLQSLKNSLAMSIRQIEKFTAQKEKLEAEIIEVEKALDA